MLFRPKKLNRSLPNKQTVQQDSKSSDWFRTITAFLVLCRSCITPCLSSVATAPSHAASFLRSLNHGSALRNLFLFSYFVGSTIDDERISTVT